MILKIFSESFELVKFRRRARIKCQRESAVFCKTAWKSNSDVGGYYWKAPGHRIEYETNPSNSRILPSKARWIREWEGFVSYSMRWPGAFLYMPWILEWNIEEFKIHIHCCFKNICPKNISSGRYERGQNSYRPLLKNIKVPTNGGNLWCFSYSSDSRKSSSDLYDKIKGIYQENMLVFEVLF